MSFWLNKRVVVTGGAGFLGSAVTNKLNQAGCQAIVPRSKNYDLRERSGSLDFIKRCGPTS